MCPPLLLASWVGCPCDKQHTVGFIGAQALTLTGQSLQACFAPVVHLVQQCCELGIIILVVQDKETGLDP